MDRLSFLHKEITLYNYTLIQQEFSNYYYNNVVKYGLVTQFFNAIDKTDCLEYCPNFLAWLADNNLSVRGITYIRAHSNTSEGIHIDSITEHYDPWDKLVSLALNIPITDNCSQTHTVWYKRISGTARNWKIENKVGLTLPFLNYSTDTKYSEIARTSLKTSTLLNIRVYHNVINPLSEDRVAVSIRFTTDPWWLIGL